MHPFPSRGKTGPVLIYAKKKKEKKHESEDRGCSGVSCAPVCRRVVTVTKAQENFLYNLASYSEHNVHMYIVFLFFFLHLYFTSLYNPYVPCAFLCGLFSSFFISLFPYVDSALRYLLLGAFARKRSGAST